MTGCPILSRWSSKGAANGQPNIGGMDSQTLHGTAMPIQTDPPRHHKQRLKHPIDYPSWVPQVFRVLVQVTGYLCWHPN